MKIYNEAITIQSKKAREVFDLTSQIKAAMEKSAFRDGIILVSALHANAAVVVNDNEPGLLEDLDAWLGEVAPAQMISSTRAGSRVMRPFTFRASCCITR
ncbi:MAG: YjbQ family protein [Candidatus Acidiferrales bacterium]